MKRWQKVVIALLGILVVFIGGVSAYGIKLMGEANQTVNQISKGSNRQSTKRKDKERGVSIEMAARDLRYEWFDQMADVLKSDINDIL